MTAGNQNKLLLSIIASLFVGFALAGCQATPRVSDFSADYYYTKTDDGMTLALRRYQPVEIDQAKNPIILCHGLSYNLLFWDLREDVSLAQYLAQAGYDVWSLSLRGACPSSQPMASAVRIVSVTLLGPSPTTVTSPPNFSLRRRASSTPTSS